MRAWLLQKARREAREAEGEDMEGRKEGRGKSHLGGEVLADSVTANA
jgi:hypothetical protein